MDHWKKRMLELKKRFNLEGLELDGNPPPKESRAEELLRQRESEAEKERAAGRLVSYGSKRKANGIGLTVRM